MPYLVLKDGSTEYIADQATYDARYQQEWEVQPKEGDAGNNNTGASTAVAEKEEGELEKVDQQIESNEEFLDKFRNKDGSLEPSQLEQEVEGAAIGLGKIGVNALRNIPQGFAVAGDLVNELGLKQFYDKEAADKALKELFRTGKRPDGFSYGVKPGTPLIGFLSEDSEFTKLTRPKNFWARLSSEIISAFSVGGWLDDAIRGTAFAPKYSYGVWSGIKGGKYKQALTGAAAWLIKEAAPEIALDSLFIGVDLPEDWEAKLAEIRDIESDEEKFLAMETIFANPEGSGLTDFDIKSEWLKEQGIGVTAMIVLRGAFKLGAHWLREMNKGSNPQVARETAQQLVLPGLEKDIANAVAKEAPTVREAQLGKLNSQIVRDIDETAAEIANDSRGAGQSYLDNRTAIGQELDKTTKQIEELDKTVDPKEIQRIDKQIINFEGKYRVKTPEEFAKKLNLLEERLKAYEAAAEADPSWILRQPLTKKGVQTQSNLKRLNSVTKQVAELAQLEALKKLRGDIDGVVNQRLGLTAKLDELLRKIDEGLGPFNESINNDAKRLARLEGRLDERRALLEGRNAQAKAEGRLEDINEDYNFPGASGEGLERLRNLIRGAENARKGGTIDDNFINNYVQEADDVHHSLINNAGGMAPVVPEILDDAPVKPGSTELPQELEQLEIENLTGDPIPSKGIGGGEIPAKPSPIENRAPVTTNEAGDLVVNKEELAGRESVIKPRRGTKQPDGEKFKRKRARELKRGIDLKDADQLSLDLLKDVEDVAERRAQFLAENPFSLDESTKIFNTDSLRYAKAGGSADLMAARIEKFRTLPKRTLEPQYQLALKYLGDLAKYNPGNAWRVLATREIFENMEAMGGYVSKNFAIPMAGTSLLNDTLNLVLNDARVLGKFRAIDGVTPARAEIVDNGVVITKGEALRQFSESYRTFLAAMKGFERTFYAAGNWLRLLDPRRRLLMTNDPKTLFNQINTKLAGMGTADEVGKLWEKNFQESLDWVDQNTSDVFSRIEKGQEITEKEWLGFERLIEKIASTKGDLSKFKEIEVTADSVLARLQVGNPLSSVMLPWSMVWQAAGIDTPMRLTLQGLSMAADSQVAKWILKDDVRARESWQQYTLARDTLLSWRLFLGQAFEATMYRFLTGRSITDSTDAFNRAYNLSTGGKVRESKVMDDLNVMEMRVPLIGYVLSKGKNIQPEIFDMLNKARVTAKVFHDYMMPGEAWGLRSKWGKLAGIETTAIRATGLGKQSYYPAGEEVNMTLWAQLAALADEFTSSSWGNAWVQSKAMGEVRELMSKAGDEIQLGDLYLNRNEELNKLLVEKANQHKLPVKAGADDTVIGYSVLDDQITQLTQWANRTEELTGPLEDISKAINVFRKSDIAAVRWFGRETYPFVTAPLNGVRNLVMLASGGEIVQFNADMARIALKKGSKLESLQPLMDRLDRVAPKWRSLIKDFESKYTSSDVKVRTKAQGALALATTIQGMLYFWTMDGEQLMVGDKTHTYKNDKFTNSYTWIKGGFEIPIRWLGVVGDALALNLNLRDTSQFGSTRADPGFVYLTIGTLAASLLDQPAAKGTDDVIRMLKAADTGNFRPLKKWLTEAYTKYTGPHTRTKQQIIELFTSKPGYKQPFGKAWYEPKRVWEEGAISEGVVGVASEFGNLTSKAYEYSTIGMIANSIWPLFDGIDEDGPIADIAHERYKSRQSIWYGKPGEVMQPEYQGVAGFIQQPFGRTFPVPNEDNPVNAAMILYVIKPPSYDLYRGKTYGGIVIEDRIINLFGHFLQNEYQFTGTNGEELLGSHAYFEQVLKNPVFKAADKEPDSPYRVPSGMSVPFLKPLLDTFAGFLGIAPEEVNWDRPNNERKAILSNERDRLFKDAKEQWYLLSKNPATRGLLKFPMPQDLVDKITQNRNEVNPELMN